MLVSAAVVFAVVYSDTGTELRRQIDRDVAGDTDQLAQGVRGLGAGSAAELRTAAAHYLRGQPYSATSTILFVIVPGHPTASNHPELFGGARAGDGESATEQALENSAGARLLVPRLGYATRRVPDVGQVRILERSVRLHNFAIVVGSGIPLALVERAQHGVARAFVLAGALTLLIALLASYLAGAHVTAPLRRMAGVAARVDAGEFEPRMEPSAGGEEVRILADSFNHMLDRLSDAFTGQREFIADASHELRTPLTVIRGQLEVLAAQAAPSGAEVRRVEALVQAEITRISRLVDDLLLLAQAEQTDFLRIEEISLGPFVADLWDGLSLTAARRFELGPVPEGTLRADPDRLAQALRNLARNAIEHTAAETGLVRLEVERVARDRIRFAVLDDGAGIPLAERQRVFERFHRTDPARSRSAGGAGLGLAIVRAVAEAHGGEVRAADTRSGPGARIELVLPGFQWTRAPAAGDAGPPDATLAHR